MSPIASALVGRRDETIVLERALETAEHGRSHIVALVGEPGIGKSRLLWELAGRAEARGLPVAAGRASELERDLTFALLTDALDPLVEGPARDSVDDLSLDEQRELVRILPAVGRVAEPEVPQGSGERHHVARAMRRLLGSMAGRRPFAVVLDDIQWADPASAEVLALLLHRPPEGGVLLAMASRPGLTGAVRTALSAAEREGRADVIELAPLSEDLIAEFLPDLGPQTRERLYRESGGNPFYLLELARALGSARAEGPGAAARIVGVPRSVRTALAAEIAGLTPEVRATLQGAAVAGDPFELGLAAAVAGVDEVVALAALDELLAAELVRAAGPATSARPTSFRRPLGRWSPPRRRPRRDGSRVRCACCLTTRRWSRAAWGCSGPRGRRSPPRVARRRPGTPCGGCWPRCPSRRRSSGWRWWRRSRPSRGCGCATTRRRSDW